MILQSLLDLSQGNKQEHGVLQTGLGDHFKITDLWGHHYPHGRSGLGSWSQFFSVAQLPAVAGNLGSELAVES